MSFNALNYLLYEKDKTELDPDLLQEFVPFLCQKVFSFYDGGKHVNYVNDTLNQYTSIFLEKEDQFRFYDAIIPKLSRRKWEYIKKTEKKTKAKPPSAIPEFYSKREIDILKSYNK